MGFRVWPPYISPLGHLVHRFREATYSGLKRCFVLPLFTSQAQRLQARVTARLLTLHIYYGARVYLQVDPRSPHSPRRRISCLPQAQDTGKFTFFGKSVDHIGVNTLFLSIPVSARRKWSLWRTCCLGQAGQGRWRFPHLRTPQNAYRT